MKMTITLLTMLFLLISLLIVAASGAFALSNKATADKGKTLFNDPKLGTNGKSCNDCHKNGAGLERAAERKDLENMINGCIRANLNGSPLKPGSAEMQSLVLYIRSLGAVNKPQGKKSAVGC